MFRHQLEAIVEGKDGLFYVQVYSITGYTAKTLNLPDFSNLTPEDLHTDKNCSWVSMKAATGIYAADKRDCRHGNNGKYSVYRQIMSCTSIRVVVPMAGDEHFTSVPYELLRKGKRFPYPYPLDEFDLPCKDTNDE